MRLRLNGKKYKYSPYWERIEFYDEPNPTYELIGKAKIFYEGSWKECRFIIPDLSKKMRIFISPSGLIKDGVSDIGIVKDNLFVDTIDPKYFTRFLIRVIHFRLLVRLGFFNLYDLFIYNKKKFIIIFILIILILFFIIANQIFDGILLKLLENNLIFRYVMILLGLITIIGLFFNIRFKKPH